MSTVPTVKATLQTIFAGLDAQVIYGPRSAVTVTKQDVLTIGKVLGTSEFSAMAGPGLIERYTVELEAMSSRPGVSQQLADDAAMATFEAARTLVYAHDFGPQISVDVTAEFELDEQADSNGRHSIVRFVANVMADF